MLFHPESATIIYESDDAIVARPLSFAANGKYCAVRASYANLVKLTELDLETPDPLNGYAFPSLPGTEPFDTQRQVTSFMVLNPRSFILSDLRTGKTRAALWAADWLMAHAKKRLSCLILSDITALEATWAVEITTHFLGRRTYELLFGTADARVAALAREADFYLLNHDALRIGRPRRIVEKDTGGKPLSVKSLPAGSLYKALIEKNFDIVVFDEAATYREHRTEMARAAAQVSRHAAYCWLLTGTPTPNGTPLDAYGLKRLCHPWHRLTFGAWREATTVPNGPFRREPKPEAEALVDELLSPAIRIRQDQCFAATPLIGPVDVHCPLSDEQLRHMKELKRELVLMLDGGAEITAVNEAALRAKLLQIACGVCYDEEHNPHLIDAGPRLRRLKQLVAALPGKILVFAPLTSVVRMLARELGETATEIISTQTKRAKLAALREWQHDPHKRIVVSHPGPIARGIDLSAASNVIWYTPCDRTEQYGQANERINGVNQKNTRRIIRLSGNSLETDIYNRLERNLSLQGAILRLKEII